MGIYIRLEICSRTRSCGRRSGKRWRHTTERLETDWCRGLKVTPHAAQNQVRWGSALEQPFVGPCDDCASLGTAVGLLDLKVDLAAAAVLHQRVDRVQSLTSLPEPLRASRPSGSVSE